MAKPIATNKLSKLSCKIYLLYYHNFLFKFVNVAPMYFLGHFVLISALGFMLIKSHIVFEIVVIIFILSLGKLFSLVVVIELLVSFVCRILLCYLCCFFFVLSCGLYTFSSLYYGTIKIYFCYCVFGSFIFLSVFFNMISKKGNGLFLFQK